MKRCLFVFSILLSVSLFACTEQKTSAVVSFVQEKGKVIDSLLVDLNKDGKLDKISVLERKPLDNHLLVVQLYTKEGYQTIQKNQQIIPCNTCGYQSGNPYIGLQENENGFDLFMEYTTYSFLFQNNEIVLQKIDLLHTQETEEGIEEIHEIYTNKDFGALKLADISNDIILKLRKK